MANNGTAHHLKGTRQIDTGAIWWMKRVGVTLAYLVALYLVSLLAGKNMDPYYFQLVIQSGIFIILAVSLNLINGVTGQFSIGHAGFYAVGAYIGASWTMLAQPHLVKAAPFLTLGSLSGDSLNLLIALVLGTSAAGLAGLLVGLPSLRLRGDYLAIVTLGFGEVIRGILLNLDIVGGPRGMSGIPALVLSNDLGIFWVFLVATVIILISSNLLRSVRGLTWLAVREDEIAADAMGVDTTRVKVTAFVIGSAFAGAAGVLFAHFFTGISPDSFDMNTSIMVTTMVILGGTGSISGSVLAAVVLFVLPELLRSSREFRMVIFSTSLIVMMLTRPQGMFGSKELSLRMLQRLIPGKKGMGEKGAAQ